MTAWKIYFRRTQVIGLNTIKNSSFAVANRSIKSFQPLGFQDDTLSTDLTLISFYSKHKM